MSYFRRGLSGVQSRPQGGRVARGALGGVQSRPKGGRVARGALGTSMIEWVALPQPPPPPPPARVMAQRQRVGPRWYRQMQGLGSLGVDTLDGPTLETPTLGEPDATRAFRRDLLAQTRAIQEHEQDRIHKEQIRGYIQIAATLSIPLAAALWRMLGIGKRFRKDTATTAP